PPRPAGMADPAAHRDHGAGGTRRTLRAGIRWTGDPGFKPADERGRRAEGHTDTAGAGTADALHALAGAGAALCRDRDGIRRAAHWFWRPAGGSREHPDDAGRAGGGYR